MRPSLRRRRDSRVPLRSRSLTSSLTRSPAIPAADCSDRQLEPVVLLLGGEDLVAAAVIEDCERARDEGQAEQDLGVCPGHRYPEDGDGGTRSPADARVPARPPPDGIPVHVRLPLLRVTSVG